MKVFLSWSKPRSQILAEALAPWLHQMLHSVEVWISTDAERGVKWIDEINRSLDSHSFGILCVTPENVDERWLNFEAGALSKHLGFDGRVIPLLLGFESASQLPVPLGQFNASIANEIGIRSLIKTLNNHVENKLSERELDRAFTAFWPNLAAEIIRAENIPTARKAAVSHTDPDEMLMMLRAMYRNSRFDAAADTPSAELDVSRLEGTAHSILVVHMTSRGAKGARFYSVSPDELMVIFPAPLSKANMDMLPAIRDELINRLSFAQVSFSVSMA